MEKETIKNAFLRVKEDMIYLNDEIVALKEEITQIHSILTNLQEEISKKPLKYPILPSPTLQQTDRQIYQTHPDIPTDKQTVPQEIGGLKSQNTGISTGNEGVPTDRQTHRQTNQQTDNSEDNVEQNLKKANEIFNSLDNLKKEIRQKFKKLTPQEMTVFSSIYQIEEQDPENTTYKQVSSALGLSESSIRDYVLKMIRKGIPIKKQKISNKKVILSISPELKKVATLSTIIQLRGL